MGSARVVNMKENPKKRGRKLGSTNFTNVSLEELNRIFKPNAAIPVNAKFLAAFRLVAAPMDAPLSLQPIEKELTFDEEYSKVEIKKGTWD